MRRLLRERSTLGLAASMLFLVAACRTEVREAETKRGTSPGSMTRAGSLEGFVRLAGNGLPRPTRVENTTDPAVCGRAHTLEDILVSAGNRGIQNAILALVDVAPERIPPARPGRLSLDNVDCRFSPHASVLTVGSTIEATSSDPVLHTTHFYGAIEANLALPFKGTRATKTAGQPGMIVVKCDVHGWMQAFIRVDPHPFHAVTDASGSFRIPDIPPGTYSLDSWHERLGSQRKSVQILGGKTERVELVYRPAEHEPNFERMEEAK